MFRLDLVPFGRLSIAAFPGEGAARVEPATGRSGQRVGDFTLQPDQIIPCIRVGGRDRGYFDYRRAAARNLPISG